MMNSVLYLYLCNINFNTYFVFLGCSFLYNLSCISSRSGYLSKGLPFGHQVTDVRSQVRVSGVVFDCGSFKVSSSQVDF